MQATSNESNPLQKEFTSTSVRWITAEARVSLKSAVELMWILLFQILEKA
jgi:hypothetical protein